MLIRLLLLRAISIRLLIKDKHGTIIRYIELNFWVTGPDSLGMLVGRKLVCNFTDATYLNKWITVTAMYDGTTATKLWINGISKSDGWNSILLIIAAM